MTKRMGAPRLLIIALATLCLACQVVSHKSTGRIDCSGPTRVKYFKAHKARIDSVLREYITSKRTKFTYDRFCAYELLSDKGGVSYVFISDNRGTCL
jgi:hypothetical protein